MAGAYLGLEGARGIEPELVSERISELRGEKETLLDASGKLGAEREETEADEIAEQLARVPDPTVEEGAPRGPARSSRSSS